VSLDLDTPLAEAVREKRLVLVRSAEERSRYPDAIDYGLQAGAYVPLLYQGEAVGVMTLGFSAAGEFDEDERAFLLVVGHQCAQALARGRLYEQQAFVSQKLQRQLLPQRVPDVAWLDVASSYRALGEGTEVGGDFYDLMPATDGWAALIGDVQGKGIDAAGVAGAARHIIRGLARGVGEPGLIVQGANQALMADLDVDRFVTLALVMCTHSDEGVVARIASAGHPAPLVLRGDGSVERIDEAGLIIGVDLNASYQETRCVLAPGDAIVLYTDGIIEARQGREAFGEERAEAAVARASGGTAEKIVEALTQAVAAFEGPHARDDQAVLVLRAR
jgi:serine phosphatase RsbU (regulator of sigma subunit)